MYFNILKSVNFVYVYVRVGWTLLNVMLSWIYWTQHHITPPSTQHSNVHDHLITADSWTRDCFFLLTVCTHSRTHALDGLSGFWFWSSFPVPWLALAYVVCWSTDPCLHLDHDFESHSWTHERFRNLGMYQAHSLDPPLQMVCLLATRSDRRPAVTPQPVKLLIAHVMSRLTPFPIWWRLCPPWISFHTSFNLGLWQKNRRIPKQRPEGWNLFRLLL